MFQQKEINRRPSSHLINILRETKKHHPNFCLLLGAGASATSGIKTATQMIQKWRRDFHSAYGNGENFDNFIQEQSFCNKTEEYSLLFEGLYDQPSQRREYIETICSDARPSWGYIYLVNLLAKNVFNTVFTTNFDDLLNEACYLFSETVRPIVCAHDSSIKYVRITSKRPKIVKLHGDFLFDNIKNTIRELEALEDNMKDKFRQYASEYGLIVVGYAGNDRSIMDTLNTLLRTEDNFPHGIYWCVRRGEELSSSVHDLCNISRVHVIEIEGFDEFFADLHDDLDFSLQDPVSDPFGVVSKRLNDLISTTNIPFPGPAHRVITKHIAMIAKRLSPNKFPYFSRDQLEMEELLANTEGGSATPVPYRFLAQHQLREGKYENAYKYILQKIHTEPVLNDFKVAFQIIELEWHDEYGPEIVEFLKSNSDLLSEESGSVLGFSLSLMHAGKYQMARDVLNCRFPENEILQLEGDSSELAIINYGQSYSHEGKEIPKPIVEKLKQIEEGDSDIWAKFGCYVLFGNKEKMREFINNVDLEESLYMMSSLPDWPIFSLIPDELKELVESRLRHYREKQIKGRRNSKAFAK